MVVLVPNMAFWHISMGAIYRYIWGFLENEKYAMYAYAGLIQDQRGVLPPILGTGNAIKHVSEPPGTTATWLRGSGPLKMGHIQPGFRHFFYKNSQKSHFVRNKSICHISG